MALRPTYDLTSQVPNSISPGARIGTGVYNLRTPTPAGMRIIPLDGPIFASGSAVGNIVTPQPHALIIATAVGFVGASTEHVVPAVVTQGWDAGIVWDTVFWDDPAAVPPYSAFAVIAGRQGDFSFFVDVNTQIAFGKVGASPVASDWTYDGGGTWGQHGWVRLWQVVGDDASAEGAAKANGSRNGWINFSDPGGFAVDATLSPSPASDSLIFAVNGYNQPGASPSPLITPPAGFTALSDDVSPVWTQNTPYLYGDMSLGLAASWARASDLGSDALEWTSADSNTTMAALACEVSA